MGNATREVQPFCSADPARAMLSQPGWFERGGRGWAFGTDGHSAMCVAATGEPRKGQAPLEPLVPWHAPEFGQMSVDVAELFCGTVAALPAALSVSVCFGAGEPSTVTMWRSYGGKKPRTVNLVDNATAPWVPRIGGARRSVDPCLFAKAMQSVSRGVRLFGVDDALEPIIVAPTFGGDRFEHAGRFALVMPRRM